VAVPDVGTSTQQNEKGEIIMLVNKSKLMKYSHTVAKTIMGDYRAKLSLAMRIVWRIFSRRTGSINTIQERLIQKLDVAFKSVKSITKEVSKVGRAYLINDLAVAKREYNDLRQRVVRGMF
jgi:hypothetical protein